MSERSLCDLVLSVCFVSKKSSQAPLPGFEIWLISIDNGHSFTKRGGSTTICLDEALATPQRGAK